MAHVILGLLLLRPMSLYLLIKAFDGGVSLFYSASSGSIKRALDTLLDRELIEVIDAQEGPRGRKTYGITEAGREAFRAWMLAPVDEANLDVGALSRLYFLGMLPEEDRPAVLAEIKARIERDLARLRETERVVRAAPVPEGLEDVARYGMATLDYGLASYGAGLAWFEQFERAEAERERGGG